MLIRRDQGVNYAKNPPSNLRFHTSGELCFRASDRNRIPGGSLRCPALHAIERKPNNFKHSMTGWSCPPRATHAGFLVKQVEQQLFCGIGAQEDLSEQLIGDLGGGAL